MKPLSIRLRLTCWYFIMFASAAALLSMASLWMLHRTVDETENHELRERADDVAVVLNREDPSRSLQQLSNDFAAIYTLKDDGKYLQVRDEQGNWVYRSSRMVEKNLDLPAPANLPKAGVITEFAQGDDQVRALSYSIFSQGKLYSAQVGVGLDKPMALLAGFRTKLLLLTPIMALLAAVGGHAMSREALRPVAKLAAEIQHINDRSLDIRLPISGAKDEILELSQTMNQMLERIDRAFASVRAFTGNASHELRTPIALLRTEIEVALLRPRGAADYRSTLCRLHEQTARMTSLVENLLSLARADGGAEAIAITPVPVSLLLRQAEEAWKSTMDLSMLNFVVEIPDDSLLVLADQRGILRLLSILIENANRFSPPGSLVRLYTTADDTCVTFSVQDTGLGIAPEHKLRIFERFYRISPSSGAPGNGSGLGLALAKWIAELHGTELTVDSEPGRGSCFSFSLMRTRHTRPAIRSLGHTLSTNPEGASAWVTFE
jgi:signal transduction histidine kinase